MKKRIFSMLLAVCMIVSLLPMTTFHTHAAGEWVAEGSASLSVAGDSGRFNVSSGYKPYFGANDPALGTVKEVSKWADGVYNPAIFANFAYEDGIPTLYLTGAQIGMFNPEAFTTNRGYSLAGCGLNGRDTANSPFPLKIVVTEDSTIAGVESAIASYGHIASLIIECRNNAKLTLISSGASAPAIRMTGAPVTFLNANVEILQKDSGTLGYSGGIEAGTVTFNNSTVYVEALATQSGRAPIKADNVYIQNGSNVTIMGTDYGINFTNELKVENSTLTATVDGFYKAGNGSVIYTETGDITINNSNVTLSRTMEKHQSYYANGIFINGAGSLTVSGANTVLDIDTNSQNDVHAIRLGAGATATINAGTVDAMAWFEGYYGNGAVKLDATASFTVNGGTVTLTSNRPAVAGQGTFTINGGTIYTVSKRWNSRQHFEKMPVMNACHAVYGMEIGATAGSLKTGDDSVYTALLTTQQYYPQIWFRPMASQHNLKDKTINADGSCTQVGTKVVRCSGCGHEFTVVNENSGKHLFNTASDQLASAATVTSPALYYAKCDTCGIVSDTETVPVGEPLQLTVVAKLQLLGGNVDIYDGIAVYLTTGENGAWTKVATGTEPAEWNISLVYMNGEVVMTMKDAKVGNYNASADTYYNNSHAIQGHPDYAINTLRIVVESNSSLTAAYSAINANSKIAKIIIESKNNAQLTMVHKGDYNAVTAIDLELINVTVTVDSVSTSQYANGIVATNVTVNGGSLTINADNYQNAKTALNVSGKLSVTNNAALTVNNVTGVAVRAGTLELTNGATANITCTSYIALIADKIGVTEATLNTQGNTRAIEVTTELSVKDGTLTAYTVSGGGSSGGLTTGTVVANGAAISFENSEIDIQFTNPNNSTLYANALYLNGGSLTIDGGNVNLKANTYTNVGGLKLANGATAIINDGTVYMGAFHNSDKVNSNGGAQISADSMLTINGGTVTIQSGNIALNGPSTFNGGTITLLCNYWNRTKASVMPILNGCFAIKGHDAGVNPWRLITDVSYITKSHYDQGHTFKFAAAEHRFSDKTINDDATCTQDGTKVVRCSTCGQEYTVTNEGSAGHTHTYTSNGNKTHTIGCANCDYAVVADCADENGDNFCDLCEAKLMTPVATVDGVGYETWAEVLGAIKADSVVNLLTDVTISETINVTGNLTVNGNGHTLTYTGYGADARAFNVNGVVADLTINNLTINCTSAYCQRAINYNTSGNLTLDGVTIMGTNITYAVNLPGSSDNAVVNITNSNIAGNIALNIWGADMKVYVTDTVLTSIDNSAAEGYAAISVNNDGAGNAAENTMVYITGGSIIAKDEKGELSSAIRIAAATATVNVSETTEVTGKYVKPVVIVTYENTTDFYSFTTLEAAIAKVNKDKIGSIKLLADIALDAPIVVTTTVALDLNGFVLSYDSTVMGEAMITNKGNLTINDSVGTGEIYYNYHGANDATYGKGNYTISNAGTLTVNGGKIHIANLRQHAKYPIDNNSGSGDAILVINGGHLYNYNTAAIRQFCNSAVYKNSVTINGGLIEGYSAIWVQNPSKTVTAKCDLTITGGEIRTTAAAYVNGTSELKDVSSKVYFSTDGGAWSEDSFVTITGGTFNENVLLYVGAPANITIGEGAIFNGRLELEAPHTHEYEATVVAPGFETEGYTEYTCSGCGHSYKDNYTSALDVDFNVVDGKIVFVEGTGNTGFIISVFYTGEATIADPLNDWNGLVKAGKENADVNGASGYRCFAGTNEIPLTVNGNYAVRVRYTTANGETIQLAKTFEGVTAAVISAPTVEESNNKLVIGNVAGFTDVGVSVFFIGDATIADPLNDWNGLVKAGKENADVNGANGYRYYSDLSNIQLNNAGNYVVRVKYTENGVVKVVAKTITVKEAATLPTIAIVDNKVVVSDVPAGATGVGISVFYTGETTIADPLHDWVGLTNAGKAYTDINGANGYRYFSNLSNVTLTESGNYVIRLVYTVNGVKNTVAFQQAI